MVPGPHFTGSFESLPIARKSALIARAGRSRAGSDSGLRRGAFLPAVGQTAARKVRNIVVRISHLRSKKLREAPSRFREQAEQPGITDPAARAVQRSKIAVRLNIIRKPPNYRKVGGISRLYQQSAQFRPEKHWQILHSRFEAAPAPIGRASV